MTGVERVAQARALVLANPDDPRGLIDLANELRLQDRLAEGLSWARWSVSPQLWRDGAIAAAAHHGLANILLDFGQFKAADAAFQRADPGETNPSLQFHRSRALLGLGHWPQAWSLAEARWRQPSWCEGLPPQPHWLGWPEPSPITLWDEQGFGDTFQALRWLPLLWAQQPQLTLQVRPPLVRLLREALAWLGEGVTVVPRPTPATAWQLPGCHGSLLSLPALLQSRQWPDAQVLKLGPPPQSPAPRRIGLVCESGRYLNSAVSALEFRRKSMPAEQRNRLLEHLRERGWSVQCLQLGEDLPQNANFFDLAQQIQSCELLISVDTAAAHLGGALGHPTWLMLPWAAATRWGRSGSRTPLYRSVRLFRQPQHQDWSGLLDAVLEAFDQQQPEGPFVVS